MLERHLRSSIVAWVLAASTFGAGIARADEAPATESTATVNGNENHVNAAGGNITQTTNNNPTNTTTHCNVAYACSPAPPPPVVPAAPLPTPASPRVSDATSPADRYAFLRGTVPGAGLILLSVIPYLVAESKTTKLANDCRGASRTQCDFDGRRGSIDSWDFAHKAMVFSGASLVGAGLLACNAGYCIWPEKWWFGSAESSNTAAMGWRLFPGGVMVSGTY